MPDSVQTIFKEFVKKHTMIFTDRNALTSHFTPDTIPHREKQINTLASILAPSLKGGRPSNIFEYGMTGTGKTLVTKYVGQELEKMSNQGTTPVKVLYINCKMRKIADTEYRLVAELARMLGQDVPMTGLPTEQVYQIFFNILDSKEWIVIIILDEVDVLVSKMGDDFLYNFTRINQDLKKAKVCIIGITNDLNFIDILDPRVKSSLSEEEILFPPYNATELQDILKQRAKLGFHKGVLSEEVIPKCSALAAQEHGDARRALDLLRVAGEIAERRNDEKVTEKHVDIALEKIEYDRIVESVKALPKQTKIVLWSIINLIEKGEDDIQTGDVFAVYEEKCKECRLHPLTQRRISDLLSELDMMGIINAKIISLGRYGRTRQIKLDLSSKTKQKIKNILESSLVI
ncbi:MAG: ORC1-type DNA replication protein [Candidatus Aenigmarchaeota archaeon]|nr:ORC1-type DNA replication protein [Candidatus Aenigmarchaeota archaeon]OYT43094.1 MAG: cell division control protein Cdc6 [Candidatus Aenigmarchaeota archaeon ex4484_56]